MEVTVRVPATTANLGSGFDALGVALDWHSFVTLSPSDGVKVEVVGEGSGEIALDEGNIAVQALRALLSCLPEEKAKPLQRGFALRLDNRFPLTRGLGSSAAVRVGTLVAGNALLGEPLTVSQLLSLATKLEGHADNVAPALLGGHRSGCAIGREGGLGSVFAAIGVAHRLTHPRFPVGDGESPCCVAVRCPLRRCGV